MGQQGDGGADRKEAMKRLRESRKEIVEHARARMKEQKKTVDSIMAELLKGDKTVPELAEATGIPSASVMWTVAALKKYGQVAEGEVDGSYFRYRLSEAGRSNGPDRRQEAADES